MDCKYVYGSAADTGTANEPQGGRSEPNTTPEPRDEPPLENAGTSQACGWLRCFACGYYADIKTYLPSESAYSDVRCPQCRSTNNAHNQEFVRRAFNPNTEPPAELTSKSMRAELLSGTKYKEPSLRAAEEILFRLHKWRDARKPGRPFFVDAEVDAPGIASYIQYAFNQIAAQQQPEQAGAGDLAAEVLEVCKARGWSLHWTCRGAYLHLEASELIEAIRGKRGDPTSEAADVLIVLMSITQNAGIPWASVLAKANETVESLRTKPRYRGEEYTPPPHTEPATSQEAT